MLVSSHTMEGHDAEITDKFVEDFVDKLKLVNGDRCIPVNDDRQEEEHEAEEEEEGEEDEFSFDCGGANNGSPVSADDIFHNGQIRPAFPLFDQSLLFKDLEEDRKCATLLPPLRKLFIEERGAVSSSSSSLEPNGPHCAWSGKAVEDASASASASASGPCKKSNSTGFSKLRRFREFVLRSNSDGKDAFVFLNNHNNNNNNNQSAVTKKSGAAGKKREKSKKVAVKLGKKDQTASSLHEKYRTKKSDKAIKGRDNKRKSYLPYRQDLVGFFTSSNSMSKNVHPF